MYHQKSRQCAIAVLIAGAVVFLCSARVLAVDYPEVEPNNSKGAATIPAAPLVAGDALTGNTTGSSTTVEGPTSADYFLVETAAAPLGIYQHRLVIFTFGAEGHTGTIRALNQLGAPADTIPGIPWDGGLGSAGNTDAVGQTSTPATFPPRYVQWYGFGKGEQIYYRVHGTGTTVDDYFASLETLPIDPVDIGSFQAGLITINLGDQGHTTDTEVWVYDAGFDAIAGYGNDDSSTTLGGAPASTSRSWLARNYSAGVYYIAVTNFALTNDQPSPSDDNFRTGAMADFPNAVWNSSTAINVDLTFTIEDVAGPIQVPNTKFSQYDINWFKFTVLPPEGSCCLADTSCLETSAIGCANLNGVFSFGLTCGETTCIGFGACCEGVACSIETFNGCVNAGGTYQGDGTTCDPNPCFGACCRPDGFCTHEVDETACAAAGGTFLGAGTDCVFSNCFGACCQPLGGCLDETETNCAASGGTFQGYSTSCATSQCPQPNDDCASAIPLVLDQIVFGNNSSALDDGGIPTCGTSEPNQGVWYSVVGNGNTLTASTCFPGTDFDTKIQVWCSCDISGCVGGNDDAVGAPPECALGTLNRKSRVTWCSEVGHTYVIMVGGFSTAVGNFEFAVLDDGIPCAPSVPCSPPTNDDCITATDIVSVPYIEAIAHATATPDLDVDCNADANVETRYGVWFRHAPAANCTGVFSETSTNDIVIAIFEGPDCNSLVPLSCSAADTTTVDMFAGTTYWFLVGMSSATTIPSTPIVVEFDCLEPTGRCCVGNSCSVVTQLNCVGLGGAYLGDGTSCDSAAGNPQTYSSFPGIAIPDNNAAGVTDTIFIPDDVNIGDVNLHLDVTHSWVGDLIVTITHPDGFTAVTAYDRPGVPVLSTVGCSNNNLNIVLDDEGTGGLIEDTCDAGGTEFPQSPPNYVPNNPLNAFDGLSTAGIWSIQISDNAGADLGTLNSWSLIIDQQGPPPCEAGDCNCPGDTDGNQTLDGNDLASFTLAILNGSGQCADVNGDTLVNLDDVDAFVTRLVDGETCN